MNASSNLTVFCVCNISVFYWFIQTSVYCPLFIFYIVLLSTIIKFKSAFKNSYYSLILALGIADIVTLLYLLHGFICCNYGRNYLGIPFDKFLTYFYNSIGWYGGLYLNLTISLNRFTAIAFFSKYKLIWTSRIVKSLVLFCMVFGVITDLPVFLWAPEIYNIEEKGATAIVRTGKVKELMDNINLAWSIGLIAILITIYSLTVCLSVFKKKSLTSEKSKFVTDVKLLIQGIFVGIMLIVAEVAYYFPIFGDSSFLLTSILSAGFNPVIYIALDSKLRKQTLLFINSCKPRTTEVIFITSRHGVINNGTVGGYKLR